MKHTILYGMIGAFVSLGAFDYMVLAPPLTRYFDILGGLFLGAYIFYIVGMLID